MPRINDLQKRPSPHQPPSDPAAEKIAALRAQLAQLEADQLPAPRAPRAKRRANSIQYLTEEELARLFAAIRAGGSARDLALFEVAYHRGLRASEVGLLDMRHLRPDLRRLFVTRLKSGTSAEYVLTDRESSALRAWLRRRGKDPGPIFTSRRRGRAISRFQLHLLMRRYTAAAAIPEEKRHFHCMRHSCATSLIEHDVGIEDVQDHLGHRNISNTQIYAKVTSRRRTRRGEELRSKW